MKRREHRADRGCAPIRGAAFTFRTLHPPEGRRGVDGGITIDKKITITLPAIDGEEHKMTEHMKVEL